MKTSVSLKEKIIDPLHNKGWSVVNENSKILFIISPDKLINEKVSFYFRSITEQSRKQSERKKLRMQVNPFELIGDGKNILIGWSEKHKVFVAWNAYIHSKHGKSSMLSCYEDTLIEASKSGLAYGSRKNKTENKIREEIYISFNVDFLEYFLKEFENIFYNSNSDLHFPINEDISFYREEKYITMKMKLRDYKFRKKLLQIYDSQCAVCQTKVLAVLQGAHIVPVSKNGSDSEDNGILLCANHHIMFDRNLIRVNANYKLKVVDSLKNEEWFKNLEKNNNGKIYLPYKKKPSISNLEKRMKLYENDKT